MTHWRDDARAAGDITVDAMFRRAFAVFGARTAVSWDEGRRSYAEVGERAWRLAHALSASGFGRGDTIAVLSETRPEYIECYAALAALGITVATLNVRLHPRELEACLRKCRPGGLLVSDKLVPLAQALRPGADSVRHWIAFGPDTGADGTASPEGFQSYEALLNASSPEAPPRVAQGEDIHNILFTSGTTGQPKAAMISQRAAAVRGLRLAQWFGLGEEDGFIGWLPLFHCGGDESLYATFWTGGTYATFGRADVAQMFRLIERDRLSWTLLLPGVITDFLNHPQRSAHDLSSLRFAIGYANMMPQVVAQLTEACDIDFYDAFGQSETSTCSRTAAPGPAKCPACASCPPR